SLYFFACAFLGLGNGLTVSPSTAGVLSIKPELAGSAAGLNGALAVALGAVMSAIGGVLFTEANVGYSLLLMMLLLSALGLLATVFVMWIDAKTASLNVR
ncbi:MAG: Bcr/CflA family drug resistance efflux transporter, partial [Pseudomonadota bacterium]